MRVLSAALGPELETLARAAQQYRVVQMRSDVALQLLDSYRLLCRASEYLPAPQHNLMAMHDPELGCGKGCDAEDLSNLHAAIKRTLSGEVD